MPADGNEGDEGGKYGSGGLAQDTSSAAMAIMGAIRKDGKAGMVRSLPFLAIKGNVMTLLLLEALGALLLLVFIVWWTMFSGRKKGELKGDAAEPAADGKRDSD